MAMAIAQSYQRNSDLVIFCHVKGIPSINFVDGENFAKELGLVVVAP